VDIAEIAHENCSSGAEDGGLAAKTQPPKMRGVETEGENYVPIRSSLAIRHTSNDRSVALIELVSLGSKSTEPGLDTFVQKAVEALD
jgi:hypothetical protein